MDIFRIRPLEAADLAAALAIQLEVHPAPLLEDEAAFSSRLNAAMPFCLTAIRQGSPIAYLLAHGWRRATPPALGPLPREGSRPSEILWIHDLAVSVSGRNSGIGQRLVMRAFALAKEAGLREAELIAVAGATGYWRSLGFAERRPTAAMAAKLAGYGPEARWMTRMIPITPAGR